MELLKFHRYWREQPSHGGGSSIFSGVCEEMDKPPDKCLYPPIYPLENGETSVELFSLFLNRSLGIQGFRVTACLRP